MAGNLTDQVRNIAQVATAVANGDLSQKITVDARGEILELKNTHEHDGRPAVVLRRRGHARGPRGRHRGQARRPGRRSRASSGTWRDLTENVNQLAVNLTTQVRAIAEVSTAVTQGDLTRSDHRRGARRGRGAQGQHQPDDRQPARDDAAQRASRTG